MKPIKSILVLALVLAPAVASAQGYYNGGPGYRQHGYHNRMGRLAWGFSVGLGGMHDGGSGLTDCGNCNYNPITFEADGHIGAMVSQNLGILFEGQVNAQTVHSDTLNGDTVLTQSAAMVALQFWLTPQLWVKGGAGFAHLDAQDNYGATDFGGGVAVMGAIGFELLSARYFALDIQGRLIEGEYNSFGDHVTSGTVGLGFNWY
jgi:hypothetical protein